MLGWCHPGAVYYTREPAILSERDTGDAQFKHSRRCGALTPEEGGRGARLQAHLTPLEATQAWREEALHLLLRRLSHDRDRVSRLTNCSIWQDLLQLQIDDSREIFEAYLKKHRELLGIGIPESTATGAYDAPGVVGDGPGCEKPDELRPVETEPAEAAAPTEEKQPAV